ncbi:MAG: hypothetical protein AABW52_03730 [Nanoarchaeota archaeon]
MNNFEYYIFIDYSENILGYFIIKEQDINSLMPKISKFSHYRELKYKSSYIHSIKKVIEEKDIIHHFLKLKIKDMKYTLEIYADLVEFLDKNDNCLIFISIDDTNTLIFKN